MLALQHKSLFTSKSIIIRAFHKAKHKKKTLCTYLAHVHKHKDTFDKLFNLHEI